ncbi:hypothetical protein Y032_0005g2546 [Ancylostoma ceylanicum]|uniref:Uncharacterized protein n=1 Tax=Ancylostoma ceylanicum TaxID=53326 RepID=A0A016VSH1_9BILA|nr:hypothetical protein Y032_0005g2546 [Ancylostoma ceylanicum]
MYLWQRIHADCHRIAVYFHSWYSVYNIRVDDRGIDSRRSWYPQLIDLFDPAADIWCSVETAALPMFARKKAKDRDKRATKLRADSTSQNSLHKLDNPSKQCPRPRMCRPRMT